METVRQDEFQITDRGCKYEVEVRRIKFSTKEEIDVIASTTMDHPTQTKTTFIIDDESDRIARYRDVRPEELGTPHPVTIKALNKFGWYCDNATYVREALAPHDAVQPSLQYVDDLLGSIIKMEDSPLRDKPLALDLLDVAMTCVAYVNGTIKAARADVEQYEKLGMTARDDEFGDDWLTVDFNPQSDEQRQEAIKKFVSQASQDPYLAIAGTPLVNYHFGTTLDWKFVYDIDPDDLDRQHRLAARQKYEKIAAEIRPRSLHADTRTPVSPDDYFGNHQKEHIPGDPEAVEDS